MPKKINFIKNNNGLFHIYVHVPAGSIYEEEKTRGISHLLEHMLLKHTKKFTEKKILEEMTLLGGSYNATTDRDVTFYYIMTTINNYKKSIDLMHSFIVEPIFEQYELDMERKIVLEEIIKNKDVDSDLYNLSYLTVLTDDNKYAQPVEGYEKTLNNITVKDLHDYHSKRYKKYSVFINCDSKIYQDVEKYVYSKFKKNESVNFNEVIYNSLNFQSNLFIVKRDYSQYSTHIIFPSFPRSMKKENIILNFLKYCLVSSGLYSILYYQLRSRRGLIYNITSINECYRYLGILRLIIGTSNKNTDYIIGIVLNVLTKLKKEGLSEKDLKYYKRSFMNQQKYALTDDVYKTIMYAESYFYGSSYNDEEYFEIIKNMTNEDIKSISKLLFDFNKFGILSYGNYKNSKTMQNRIIDIVDTYKLI